MRIKCAKSKAPVGVRGLGRGDRAWVPCPLSGNNAQASQCFTCSHNNGEHIVAVASMTRVGNSDRGTRKIIELTERDLSKAIIEQMNFLFDNLLDLTPEQLADWQTSRHAEAIKITKD